MRLTDNDIVYVLSEHRVKDQSELARLLAERGFKTTQASLSRRLKKMGVKKSYGFYQAPKHQVHDRLVDTIKHVDLAPPNLIIARTAPASANYAAKFLDEIIDHPEQFDPTGQFSAIVGTVAGDDTIFIAVNDPAQLETIANSILDD